MFRAFGAQCVERNRKIDLQYVPIEKQQGIERLVLSG